MVRLVLCLTNLEFFTDSQRFSYDDYQDQVTSAYRLEAHYSLQRKKNKITNQVGFITKYFLPSLSKLALMVSQIQCSAMSVINFEDTYPYIYLDTPWIPCIYRVKIKINPKAVLGLLIKNIPVSTRTVALKNSPDFEFFFRTLKKPTICIFL